ncbi:nuclear transport factor 2 family protein [Nocardia sp. NPDC050799]|uniref:nuclear transport factor 2 family protein n=1 Tax=Nocardia sp. NPDC050799 TaxID=3154842 RepID=UPI0033E36783
MNELRRTENAEVSTTEAMALEMAGNEPRVPAPGYLHPLSILLRRYTHAYTNCHDFEVCRQLMTEDYTLRMGENVFRGRELHYIPATEKQFRQYPGLGITVHDVVVGTDRIAMSFSEHGRSTLTGKSSRWSGVSMYRWDGRRLTECRVEQDYHARREQMRTGHPEQLPQPALDPWTTEPLAPEPRTERVLREWLAGGGLFEAPIGSLDNEPTAMPRRVLLSCASVTVLDLFTAGPRAAFHIRVQGRYAGGIGIDDYRNRPVEVYATGLATVAGESVSIQAVTDRLAVERRLLHGA